MSKLLVFDLDGTLIHSAPDIVETANIVLDEFNRSRLPEEQIVSYIGHGLMRLIEDLFPEHKDNPAELERIANRFRSVYEVQMYNRTHLYPGVTDFLNAWDGKIGIVTNKRRGPAIAMMKHLGLDRYPWVDVFGYDSFDEAKPSPKPLREMMLKAQIPPENTLMIGDGVPDMQSALNAGIKSLAIGFGYTDPQVLKAYNPIAVFFHFKELKELLSRHGF
ncbi:MAG: HAD-IA family hydrolase [Bdellovibrionaceae bacterium]|nr:HAD-IA family hydrolase [Pseudobdellovibrionaceae bacterium]